MTIISYNPLARFYSDLYNSTRKASLEVKQFISDSYGKRFPLIVDEDSNEWFWAKLEHGGEWVGHIRCSYDELGNMIVQDFEIRKDYRGRGLGTSLFNLAINRAKNKGKKHIYGSIMQADIVETPDLIQFYEKRGFAKCANYPGCLPNAVAYIRMDLDQQALPVSS